MNAPITNRPILSAAFMAQADNDAKPLLEALGKIATKDLRMEVSAGPSKEMAVVATMNVTHLLEIGERLLNEFGIQVNISDLKVRYLETLREGVKARASTFAKLAVRVSDFNRHWRRLAITWHSTI